jgi:apolipoprotein N-acyltransferase
MKASVSCNSRDLTLTHAVPGYEGVTPFVRWGNYAFLLIAGVMLLIARRM